MPHAAADLVRHRAANLVPMIEMMSNWYARTGGTP